MKQPHRNPNSLTVSLLEPYRGPLNEITTARVILESDPTPEVARVLDSRKVGRRYDYLVSWKDLPASENSWVPHSDLPSTLDEVLEHFHRRHPTLPRPHQIDISRDRSLPLPCKPPARVEVTQLPAPLHPRVPFAPARVPSPPQPLRAIAYTPPTRTTLRSGRVSHPPPPCLDPDVHVPRRARLKEGDSVMAASVLSHVTPDPRDL